MRIQASSTFLQQLRKLVVELQESTKQEMLPSAVSTKHVNQNLSIVYFKIIEKHLVSISEKVNK